MVEQIVRQSQQIMERIPGAPVLASSRDIDRLPNDPRAFESIEVGSGAFGRWIVDTAGLPAYHREPFEWLAHWHF